MYFEKEKAWKAQIKQGKRKESQPLIKGPNQKEGTKKVWKEKAPNKKTLETEALGEKTNKIMEKHPDQ